MSSYHSGQGMSASSSLLNGHDRHKNVTASPSETSPLLASSSGRKSSLHHGRGPLLQGDDEDDEQEQYLSNKTKKRTINASKVCCWALIALLVVLALVLATLHVWIGHLVNQTDSALAMAERGFVWDGPFDVRLDQDGAQVDMAVAFDVAKALNWSASSARQRFEHKVAASIISRTPDAFVDLRSLALRDGDSVKLVETSTTLRVPLFYRQPQLRNVTVRLPLHAEYEVRHWIEQVMHKRKWHVQAEVVDLMVKPRGRGLLGWIAKRVGTTRVQHLTMDYAGTGQSELTALKRWKLTRTTVPPLPSNPDEIVQLRTMRLNSTAQAMSIFVDAYVENPLKYLPRSIPHDFGYSVPAQLSVSVFVPTKEYGHVHVAQVESNPFKFPRGASKSIVSAQGTLVQPAKNVSLDKTISRFVRRYLDGQNNTVRLRVGHGTDLPASIDQLLSNTTADVQFPGAQEGVELFRDLKIRDMRIRLPSFQKGDDEDDDADLLCSGTLSAQLLLPDAFATLHPSLNVSQLSPDVFIYDGDLPPSSGTRYPPSPIPANAFARLSPQAVRAYTSHRAGNETLIEATFRDAPLHLIPGREGVFRRYVAKVIFSGPNGVKTSIRGISDARVAVRGWTQFGLDRLNVEGSFFVKRDGVDSNIQQRH